MHTRLICGFFPLALLLSGVAAGADPSIQVGVGKTEITPREPMPLWGYSSRKDPFVNVYDPLHCRTIVFDDGKTKAAIVSLDLGRTPPGHWVDTIRTRAREQFGIDHLLLAATHTHAAPHMGSTHAPIPWIERVAAQIYRSMEIAKANMQPAVFKSGQGQVDITYDRRVVNDDGSVTMLWQNHRRERTKPVDQRIKVLQINNRSDQA
ncbi:MAG: hypothetical protein IH892_21460, partial [Planctomycetes bacterium]|nr:hypothetical protein [Planctomycetota bacterium]